MPKLTDLNVSENKIKMWPKTFESWKLKMVINTERQDPNKVGRIKIFSTSRNLICSLHMQWQN